MFKERARFYSRVQFAIDLLLSCLAFPLAYFSRVHVTVPLPDWIDPYFNPLLMSFGEYLWMIGAAILWWSVAAVSLGLYRISMRRFGWGKIRIIVECSVLIWIFLAILSYALHLNISRPLVAFFVFYQAVLLVLVRLISSLKVRRSNGDSAHGEYRNIVVIGSDARARQMCELIERYSDWGFCILGYVDVHTRESVAADGDVLGSIKDMERIIDSHIIDEIIYIGEQANLEGLDTILPLCNELGIPIRVAADFFPARVTNLSMEFLENVPVITFSPKPDYVFPLLVKRVLDIIVSSICLLILLPFFLIVGLLVRLTSRGPAIYRQVRCGLYGRTFRLYKFRSMHDGADDVLWEIKHLNEMEGPTFKMRNDPRVTPLGRFLRKSSIDEWPQFWNVLKGDMSLVGPRAPLPDEVKEYARWHKRRLSVKPGMTCLWQISGRNEINFQEWMKLDLHYIDNWSLGLDLKILVYTLPSVLFGKGAR